MQHFDVFLSQAPSVSELDVVWEEVARLLKGRKKNELLEVKDLQKCIEVLKSRVKHLEWDNKHLEKHLRMVARKYQAREAKAAKLYEAMEAKAARLEEELRKKEENQ